VCVCVCVYTDRYWNWLKRKADVASKDRILSSVSFRMGRVLHPTIVSKETYYSVKRDLLQCQKRPTTVSFRMGRVLHPVERL
jgi:hypothetical protein